MKKLRDYSDDRLEGLSTTTLTVDHVPSKARLDDPLPSDVHTIE
jgi:hypothetical protein